MQRSILALALLLAASPALAQSFWDSRVQFGPQFHSYSISSPISEKISQVAFPVFVVVPILPALTIDLGTAYANAHHERRTFDSTGAPVTVESDLSGITDTQLRANYAIGQDFLVLTAGVNLPTGSATISPDELPAATQIGSDFLTFPISGFGSGFGMTGGFALARPLGSWNVGFGASVRYAGAYEPFEDGSGTKTSFQPGPEFRVRTGVDHPYGTGRIALGLTYSQFGDDKANAASYNTGNRYVGTVSVSNSLRNGTDYSVIVWNLFRTSGTLIDQSVAPRANITNAMLLFGVRGPGNSYIEPSIETRVRAQQGSGTSFLSTLGLRLAVNRGGWAVVPGVGFSVGTLESSTLTGFRSTLTVRLGQ